MEPIRFQNVFESLQMSESFPELEGATVQELEANRGARSMRLALRFDCGISMILPARLKAVLIKHFRLSDISLEITCPSCPVEEDDVADLLEAVYDEFPALRGFFASCGTTLSETGLIFELPKQACDLVTESGCIRFMESLIRTCRGHDLRVTVRPATEDGQDMLSAFEKARDDEMRSLLMDCASNSPHKEHRPSPVGEQNKSFVQKRRPPAPKLDEADILLGKSFGDELTRISDVDFNGGNYAVEGDVFGLDFKEVSNGTNIVINFNVYDGTGSVTVKRIFKIDIGKEFLDKLKACDRVAVRGEIQYDSFAKESVLKPFDVIRKVKKLRTDDAKEKRVELHLHTKMSAMDGVVEAKAVVAQALAWGHKALAVTDHGVLHAYPDMFHAAEKKDIKILYGCEGYYVNNVEPMPALFGESSEPLDGDFVCFDLETTGLHPERDEIIEIAASLLRDGRIIDTFQTYVKPQKPIPPNISELTEIYPGTVADAPPISQALPAFLEFAKGRVLCAHNANFDISFLRAACQNAGISSDFVYIDTLPISRILLPNLYRHKLNLVAKELNLPKFKHHSGSDDARTLALILAEFFKILHYKKGVENVSALNEALSGAMDENAENGSDCQSLPSYHILLLAKNTEGVRALNKLVSMSHLQYMNSRKFPIMPRRELAQLRENLIVGSACEAGELFRAMVDGADDDKLAHIAEFYDFLEIQPIGNNAFMLRDGTASCEEDLRDFNRRIVALGERLGKPVVATGDVHFLNPEDEAFRRVLMAAKGFEDCDQQAPLYFRTTDEMLREFDYLGPEKAYEVVVKNTNAIADQCDVECPFSKEYCPPEIPGSAEELENTVRSEAARQYGDDLPEQVSKVMEKELKSIISNGYDVMYVFAQKLIERSNQCGYMVGSRGSVGSSIVAYFLGITEVNALPPHYRCKTCRYSEFHEGEDYGCGQDMPEKNCPNCGTPMYKDGFDIPFETFLGFNGDKTPDIDLNFSNEYQSKAHAHTVEMFGKENVFRAGTIGTVAEKTAFGYVRKYCEERGITMNKAEMTRLALGCTDVKRTTGQHPGGMVVVPHTHSIYEFCALQHPADDQETDTVITHVDYHSIDQNLLKFDILGHKDPTMIKHLEELTGIKMGEIDLNDPATLSLYSSTEALGFDDVEIFGNVGTCGVPEFGTKFVKQVLEDTLPSSIDELVRVCGTTHGTDVWLGNAQEIIRSGHAPLSGCICCRDDIMLSMIRWGLPSKMSFDIMEGVRKGKGLKPEWEEAMKEHNVPDWYIESCRKIKYLFPKAHAAAYVVNGFRVAWYKLHRPLAFYCAFLSVRADALDPDVMLAGADAIRAKIIELRQKTDATQVEEELQKNLEICYEFCRRGFSFLPVDIYDSKAMDFSMVGEDKLRLPFNSVPGLGENAALNLYEEAQRAPFLSIDEISQRCGKVSQTLVDKLYSYGAFRDLPQSSQSTLF